MKYPCICNDPEIIDEKFPPDMSDFALSSEGDRCFGVIYKPQGRGPHPTIILLHGFPGSERNFDLAQILRRAGFNVIVFHYRGSWGSEGNFSFQHVLTDTENMMELALSDAFAKEMSIDRERLILAGHSMGGFSALVNASRNSAVKNVISIAGYNLGAVARTLDQSEEYYLKTKKMFEECTVPLKGTGVEVLFDEIKERKEEWDLCNLSFEGKDSSVLLVAGAEDTVSEPELHHDPLYERYRSFSSNSFDVQQAVLDSSHSFHSKRIKLAETILDWFSSKGLLPE